MSLKSVLAHPRTLTLALLLTTAGCAERSGPVIGVAMGGLTDALLPARQKRFNDSVGTRHQVELKLPPASNLAGDDAGLAWANELVKTPGIVGVVGHESSRYSLQLAPLYEQRGVLQIVPTGTSSRLATVSPWTFPLVASDSSQGELLARQLLKQQRKRITVFVQDDEYGRGVAKSLKKGLEGTDATVLEDVTHTMESDFDLLVRSALSHEPAPDALVLITQGLQASQIAQLSWKRDSSLLILGSDATSTEATKLRSIAPSPNHVALVTYWLPDTTNQATQVFLSDYRSSQLAGDPQWYHAALYDAVGLLNVAAAGAGGRPSAVRDWLLSLGRTRPAYHGVMGEIDFTGKHPIPARLMRPNATGWEFLQ